MAREIAHYHEHDAARRPARGVVRTSGLMRAGAAALGAVLLASVVPVRAQSLDLRGYHLTFDDEFHALSVSAAGPGTTWTAHTPWHGDFGDAAFSDPTPGFPFTIHGGVLRIELRRGAAGHWRSGLLSSAGPDGGGFTQTYGYFEMRARFPSGDGTWPAFWLDSLPPPGSTDPSVEFDVVEHYGRFPGAFNTTLIVWPKVKGEHSHASMHITHVAPGSLSSGFHTYGAMVGRSWIVTYFDGREVWRVRTPPEHHWGFDVLVDLGLGGGWPIADTPSPSFMDVDYVRVYAPDHATP